MSFFNFWSIALLVLAILLGVYFWILKSYTFFKDQGLPFEKPKILIGNLRHIPLLFKNKHQFYFVEEIYKKHKDKTYVGMFKLRKPMLMIRDPIICQQVFTKYFEHFQDRPGASVDISKDPLSNHLISMQGEQWKLVRPKLSPAFTPSKLKCMFEDMKHCAFEFCKYLEKQVKTNDEFEVIDLFSKYDLNVSGRCILGLNAESIEKSKFYIICKEMFKPTLRSKSKQALQFLFPEYSRYMETKNISQETLDFLHNILKESVRSRDTMAQKRYDFLKLFTDMYLTELSPDVNKENITESIIMSNLFLFLTTGYQSTSSTIASLAYELALHQDIQEKVRQEVKEQMVQWSYNNVASLKYLDQVITESQRLHPVNTSLSRQCTSHQFKLPGTDIYLPRGTHVCIPTFAMYKDPKYFPDPDQFNPDRFSRDNIMNQNMKILLPFGDGPRQCIAKSYSLLEVKCLISNLLLKFKLQPCSKTEVPLSFLPDKLFITPVNGIWIRFEKLQSD